MEPTSVGDYCRAVEAHLTRVNGGNLIKVVGPAYVLVRSWHEQGIPLSIVMRGIDEKAERHQRGAGGRGRTLHIAFCEDDVLALFADWKRAAGMMSVAEITDESATRRPSLSKHLERVTEKLSRLLGRNDLSEPFLERVNYAIGLVAAARERGKGARGSARDEIADSLRPLDRVLTDAARAALTGSDRLALETQAAAELLAYRDRLDPEAWQQALTATTDRLLRERFSLPVIDPDGA